MKKHTLITGFMALMMMGGCTLMPEYTRPANPIPETLPGADRASDATTAAVAELDWDKFILDPGLQQVVQMALEHNRDLRIATLNIEKAGALYRIQRAELYPHLAATGTGEKERVPENLSATGIAYTSELYTAGVGIASWELDLFGRIRSLKAQARQQYLSTEDARSGVQISLIAGVAGSYLALAADRESLALAEKSLKAQREQYELIRKSYALGVASKLDMLQARSQVDAARINVSTYRTLVASDRNALNLVVGTTVPEDLLPENLTAIQPFAEIQPGAASEVLLNRPDIRLAERQLMAANANIGAARAAFFPRISLTAFAGSVSADLDDLLGSDSKSWSFAPQVALPIFDMGTRRANLNAAHVDHDIMVARYEQAIQQAFRETSDTLTAGTHLAEQVAAQQSLTETLEQTWQLSNARYKQGIDSYLPVLIAQRTHFQAQTGLVQLKLARMANQVELYKVLGGGQ